MQRRETAAIARDIHRDDLFQQRARRALPLLVRQAWARQPIYYSELAAELDIPNPRNLNYVLGSIGQTLIQLGKEWQQTVPPIQFVVINKATGLPGDGVSLFASVPDFARLSRADKRRIVQGSLQGIYAYPHWSRVLQALELPAPASDLTPLVRSATRFNGGVGESEAHRVFKMWLNDNPRALGIKHRPDFSDTEFILPSGDSVDVVFRVGDEWILAEAKSSISSDADLARGLFQCVKYRPSGLSLERLKTFCLIAEAGGITKAAGGDAGKQPLFSRQLKELEIFFGVELVRREGRKVVLTEPGARLHHLLRDYFGALADFKQSCADQPVELQVGAGDSVIQWLILPGMAETRKLLQRTKFKLLNLPTQQIVDKVESGELDLGVIRHDAVTGRLKNLPLGRMEFALFVPKRAIKTGTGNYEDWREILRRCSLAVLEGGGSFRQELQKAANREGFQPRIEIECSSFPAVAKAVETASLAGILPLGAGQDLPTGEFVCVKVPWISRLSRMMALVWNPRTSEIRKSISDAVEKLGMHWRL